MCCLIPSDPITDPKGRIKTFDGSQMFQTDMMHAPLAAGCSTFGWFCCQFLPFPLTMGCTQYYLRKKVLHNDMTKYICCQGYTGPLCCGAFVPGQCGERSCPDFCLFVEGCCCNGFAVSASRQLVMEKYDLRSDPCDYRLIRINNCLQMLSCICNCAAIFIPDLRDLARLLDTIADIFYHCVSGCMTAQVAHEQNYQDSKPLMTSDSPPYAVAEPYHNKSIQNQY